MMHQDSGNHWGKDEFGRLLDMIKAFGFTCFEYWLEPTLYKTALKQDGMYSEFIETMDEVNELAHARGLKVKYISSPNCIGHEWYFACPNDPEDKKMILKLWSHWAKALKGTDFVGIFPGDPGGCNRNACDHNTFINLALELGEITLRENPGATIELGTWGTPFSGWGDDMAHVKDWDGSWKMLLEGINEINVGGCHIWNGNPDRARKAMEDFIRRLPEFPDDAIVGINLGFSPDADPTVGGDAREYVREVAKLRRVSSWDYSVVEGELIVYPHWRLPRIFSRRREEMTAAPYYGAMSYTMSPKLSHLSMYAAAQASIDPDRNPDLVSREFCGKVFGTQHEMLGELFEAFEVVKGWGHHPRRNWSRQEAHRAYTKIIDHLENADTDKCSLPLFPSPAEYHRDLLWFARMFARLSGPNPDRDAIRKEYWQNCLSIYDKVPMSVDERAESAAKQFSQLFS
ncbi:MAG: hypothetical protein JW808_01075 [Victivallales bacterium]|nr:hypothetical protein [Victivallales bacterium]